MQQLDVPQLLALAAAMGWASGLRLYLVVFLVGLAGRFGFFALPPGLSVLASPVLLGASGLMLFVEFFADKIPGFDTVWDAINTFIRIPAGAALAAGALGGDQASWTLAAALMGGTLAATSHVAKSTTRAAVNTSPEPFSNIGLSLAGDAAVPTFLWLAVDHPTIFWVALALMIVLMVGLTWTLIRFLKRLVQRFTGKKIEGTDQSVVTYRP